MKKICSMDKVSPEAQLWKIALKLKGLGYLLAHQTADSAISSDEMGCGIGQIIRELGYEIDDIAEQIN